MMLKNKNILITGAGKGIGLESVKNCISEGAFVYALIKDKRDKKKFNIFPKNSCKVIIGNVNSRKLIFNIFKNSIKSKKIISGVVNNAGVRFRKKFSLITEKELHEVFKINFFSIFFLIQNFKNYLSKLKKNGSVVNICSIVGQTGFKELSAYASSKGALTSLTKSLSSELSSEGIRLNSISPGFIKTSFFKKFKKKKKLYNWTLSRIPMNRWGSAEEVSKLISFLISEDSSYINGENINIDGGWLSS
jgi:NAD(P)-dependent dehydrogenase (short-subunit alcohol dehydrogenase family)